MIARGWQVAVLCKALRRGDLPLSQRVRQKVPGLAPPVDREVGYAVYRGRPVVPRIKAVLRAFRPDVTVIQAGKQSQVASALAREGAPFVWYARDVEFERQIDDAGGLDSSRALVESAAAVVANSRFTAARFEREFGRSCHVIPPLVIPESYRCEEPLSRQAVLFVNPVPKKGVDLVFQLAERRPDIPFIIVEGWPLDEDALRALRTRAAALANVELRRNTRDMRELYRLARVLLVPSQWEEAWGRVVTEAQINGIPVLASRRGGLPESVGPGGILIDPEAPLADWESGLARLWDDHAAYDRFAERAGEHARRRPIDPESLLESFLKVATAVASGGRPAPLESAVSLLPFAVATVAIGDLYCSWCLTMIDTLRRVGRFYGSVYVVTDQASRFTSLSNVYAVPTGGVVESALQAKAYKTRLLDLVDEELILYLDVDVLIGGPLRPWWSKAKPRLEGANLAAFRELDTITGETKEGQPFHCGILLIPRRGAALLQEWRRQIETGHHVRDQTALGVASAGAAIANLPREDLLFPLPSDMLSFVTRTFTHITLTGRVNAAPPLGLRRYLHRAFGCRVLPTTCAYATILTTYVRRAPRAYKRFRRRLGFTSRKT